MEEKRICPECGKEYSSRPALSRKDNKTMICPKCGMMEALDTVRNFYAPGMTDQQWKSVCKDIVHQSDFFLCCVSVHGSKYDFVIRFDGPCREC